jgi:hypothetical protein
MVNFDKYSFTTQNPTKIRCTLQNLIVDLRNLAQNLGIFYGTAPVLDTYYVFIVHFQHST